MPTGDFSPPYIIQCRFKSPKKSFKSMSDLFLNLQQNNHPHQLFGEAAKYRKQVLSATFHFYQTFFSLRLIHSFTTYDKVFGWFEEVALLKGAQRATEIDICISSDRNQSTCRQHLWKYVSTSFIVKMRIKLGSFGIFLVEFRSRTMLTKKFVKFEFLGSSGQKFQIGRGQKK